MSFLLIFLTVIAILFSVAFVTKRRFGVLGLALAAGATLSDLWSPQLTIFLEQSGVSLIAPPLMSIVAAILILSPALVLIVSGPTYHKKWQRLGGALAFALLASVYLLEPLGGVLVLEGVGQTSYQFLRENHVLIVSGGLILAVVDILFTRTPRGMKKSRH